MMRIGAESDRQIPGRRLPAVVELGAVYLVLPIPSGGTGAAHGMGLEEKEGDGDPNCGHG